MIVDVIAENPNFSYTLGTFQSKVTGQLTTVTGEPVYLPVGYMMMYISPGVIGSNVTPYRLVSQPLLPPLSTSPDDFGFFWVETFSQPYICEWD